MKFALLGADSDSLELLTTIAQNPQHEIVAIYDANRELEKNIRGIVPHAVWRSDWESLLHEPVAEAVIVSTWRRRSSAENELRADQLRKLVQSGLPLIVVHPACESIVGFEVDMIRQDTGSLVLPYLPQNAWLPVQQMRDAFAADQNSPEVAAIEQIVVERRTTQGNDELRIHLARDILALGSLAGRIRRVNAFGTALRGGPSRLTVNVESESETAAQWSIDPAPDAPLVRIRMIGATRSVQAVRSSSQTWRLSSGDQSWDVNADEPAHQMLEHLESHIINPPDRTWSLACRAQEVVELAERSADRGRTLEIYHEEHSEQETFKGVMAVGSCAILMLTLLVLVLGSIVEGIRFPYIDQRQPFDRDGNAMSGDDMGGDAGTTAPGRPLWLRLWPVYPLIIFLLLQSLRLAFPPSESKRQHPPPDGTPPQNKTGMF